MKSKSQEKIRLEIKKNHLKREQIRKTQKKLVIVGFCGLFSIIIFLLFDYFKNPNQEVKYSFELKNNKKNNELIDHFLKQAPTIDGESASSIKITENGAWISTLENNFFTLIKANYKTSTIS